MPLESPYDSHEHRDLKPLTFRVDPKDFAYLRRMFPMQVGLTDNLTASLYHRFVQHLRNLEKLNGTAIEPAWHVGDPTYVLLDLILERCNFDDAATVRAERDAALAELDRYRQLVCDQL